MFRFRPECRNWCGGTVQSGRTRQGRGGTLRRGRWIALLAAVAVAAAGLSVAGGAGAQEDEAPQATEIGVTEDTITITVIADVENAARPGLFKGSADGVMAAAEYINEEEGGLAGRQIEVKF